MRKNPIKAKVKSITEATTPHITTFGYPLATSKGRMYLNPTKAKTLGNAKAKTISIGLNCLEVFQLNSREIYHFQKDLSFLNQRVLHKNNFLIL